jgi:hypothetical protein
MSIVKHAAMPFPRPSFDSVSCLRPQAAQPCGGRVTARKPSYLPDERRPDGMETQRRRPVARNPTRGWEREATSSSAWCPVTPHDGWLRAPLPALAPATTVLSSCPGGMEARRRHPYGSGDGAGMGRRRRLLALCGWGRRLWDAK